MKPGDRIVIDVSDEYVMNVLEMFESRHWVTEYTPVELDDPTVVDRAEHENPFQEYLEFNLALSEVGLLLTHELAHVFDGDHSEAVKLRLDELRAADKLSPVYTAKLDEPYAYSYATINTASVVWDAAVQEAAAATRAND